MLVIVVVYIFLLVFFYSMMLGFLVINKMLIKTSTMAAVMAIGILSQGVISNYFGANQIGVYGKVLSIINLALWMAFASSFLLSTLHKKFREIHFNNPINRFGMGTWIAGTSICGILIHRQFLEWNIISKLLLVINFIFWIFYIVGSCFSFYTIYKSNHIKEVHGILLLTTVSTQSLVLLMNTIYSTIPKGLNVTLICIGLCLYVIASFFVCERYVRNWKFFSVVKDWNNTNCILHGALSITGLACLFSNTISASMILFIWFCATAVFIIVELIEIYRLIKRVRNYGVRQGIFVYDVTQWSRIFTFGMYYTFTFLTGSTLDLHHMVQTMTINSGIWIILSLTVIEIVLSLKVPFEAWRTNRVQQKEFGKQSL